MRPSASGGSGISRFVVAGLARHSDGCRRAAPASAEVAAADRDVGLHRRWARGCGHRARIQAQKIEDGVERMRWRGIEIDGDEPADRFFERDRLVHAGDNDRVLLDVLREQVGKREHPGENRISGRW